MQVLVKRAVRLGVLAALSCTGFMQGQTANATSGRIQGTVKDTSGAVIPGVVVTVTDHAGQTHQATTQGNGHYVVRDLPPGLYSVAAAYTGLEQKSAAMVTVTAATAATANLQMAVRTQKQEVTVSDSNPYQVSTEAANNASALVLRQEDLDALPDDPDDLQADLQSLAGPSAGPGGSQIFIDGFAGGRLPPKSSIREIRINSNPFSSEYDKLGFGRIEIFTKPGTDKFHGQGYYGTSRSGIRAIRFSRPSRRSERNCLAETSADP